jgi:hypothetical protein
MVSKTIFIQLDNATPHNVDSAEFNRVCDELGIDCRIIYQPPQSPDFNICDLSFFPAIQSLYFQQENIVNKHRLIAAVAEAFRQYDCNKLNRAFLSLFQNYNMVLQHNGSNIYKVPHMGKGSLERRGLLPERITVEFPVDVPEDFYFDGGDYEELEFSDSEEEEDEEVQPANNLAINVDNNFDDTYSVNETDSESDGENTLET